MNQLLIQPYTYRRKQAYALALATVIYLLFAALLFIELRYYQTEQSRAEPQEDRPPVFPIRSQQDKGPAPVRFMNMPQQPTPQAAVPVQQPAQPTPPSPSESPATKIVPPDSSQQKSAPLQPAERTTPKVEQRKAEEKTKTHAEPQVRSAPKKRSKDKWFKPADNAPSTTNQTSMPHKDSNRGMMRQQFASNLSHGFNNFVTQRKKTSFQYSINRVKGNAAESLEYEMFAGKMVHNICTATNYSPLDLRKALIREHDIVVQVTCNKDRTIGDITFLQPSYDDQINDYLIAIMKTVSPPKFPSSHATNTLTFPMKIHITRQYYGRGLRMVPA